MKKTMVCAVGALAACGVLTTSLAADAADCSTLTNPVYVAGSSASKPIWVALASKFAALNVSIVYQSVGSCVGLNDVSTAVADQATANYIDGNLNPACTNPGPVTIGVSDVFPTSCPNFTLPTGYADFQGPIQTMTISVPSNSIETSINADAAYTVFGWGGTQYPVASWTSYTSVWMRGSTSGTQTMIASAIGLAATKWLSQVPDAGAGQIPQPSGSGAMLAAIQAGNSAATPSQTIGILASDLADSNRGPLASNDAGKQVGGVKVLAFQAKNQDCGYLPDSDSTHFDKINVRQGRYDIWGPLHMVTAVDGTGAAKSAQAKTVLDYVQAKALADTDLQALIGFYFSAHVIPQCAMQVSRSAEVAVDNAGMASYQPPKGCGCFYESQGNGGNAYSKYCTKCSTATDCTNAAYPKCNFGFCEAQ
jgi:hypothetical protein